ncbi:MAG: hypothetical protein J5J00_10155 [Deltaproteobacteria bacterium]|nr:hypothetical protein [Deltaproteobacteria bacterium]
MKVSFILTVLLMSLAGCASLGLDFSFSSASESPSAIVDQAPLPHPRVPFQLEVVDEVNDGQRLHVLGSISSEADWQMRDVVVKLTGLKEGSLVGVSYLPLQKIASEAAPGGMIRAGEKYSFSLSLPANEITDYQLELMWGRDAAQYLKEIGSSQGGTVEIRNIEVTTFQEQCGLTGCTFKHKISGRLVNSTLTPVNRVVLGVGFLKIEPGAALDLSKQIPENEERVEVPNVSLEPGGSRSIKLDIERSVPDPNMKPVMRIISYDN